MARPRTYNTHGVVLKQMPLGEADRLLTLYTPDKGKLRAVARGVRRTKSKLAGHVEPLVHVRVSVAEGKTLDVIAEAETVRSFRSLRENLQQISRAVYLTDLVERFSAEQSPNEEVFDLLLGAFVELESDRAPGQLMRYFEVQLLARSGFGPELHRCVDCFNALEPGDHLFSCSRGGILCPNCRVSSQDRMVSISLGATKVLRYFQRADLERAAVLRIPSMLSEELERILGTYVRYVLDADPKSAEFVSLVGARYP